MKRFLAALALLFGAHAAMAMDSSSIPPKFGIPWGNSAGGAYLRAIPQASQIGITNCAASLTDGFPPLTFQNPSAGGCPPFGQDFNGILKQITQWSQWQNAGAQVLYDSGFSAAIGGYPQGAVLGQAATVGCFWVSSVDNNLSDPDTAGGNWINGCLGALEVGITTITGGGSGHVVYDNAGVLGELTTTGSGTTAVLATGPTIFGINLTGTIDVGGNPMTFPGAAATLASLTGADQTLSGGANVSAYNIGTITTGTLAVDCGKSPLQYLTDNGAFTIAAPANDGSCILLLTNGATAQIPTFSGFTVNSNTGEPLTTVSASKFTISVWRVDSVSSFLVKALQ